jgi:hypothetical protein
VFGQFRLDARINNGEEAHVVSIYIPEMTRRKFSLIRPIIGSWAAEGVTWDEEELFNTIV